MQKNLFHFYSFDFFGIFSGKEICLKGITPFPETSILKHFQSSNYSNHKSLKINNRYMNVKLFNFRIKMQIFIKSISKPIYLF